MAENAAENAQEAAIKALREGLERILAEQDAGRMPIFQPPENDTFVDIKAECSSHGDVRVVNEGGRPYCFECVKACREGRTEEVVSIGRSRSTSSRSRRGRAHLAPRRRLRVHKQG
jgi:hypothetical protein